MKNPTLRVLTVGHSLYVRLPLDFIRANNLKAGDMITPDLSTFKIIKQEDLATLSREPEAMGLIPAE
jgi:hypothetical protein